MIDVKGKDRLKYKDFFKDVPYFQSIIHPCFEKDYQYMIVDDVNNPTVAAIWCHGYVVYAGNPASPSAKEALKAFEIKPTVLAYSPEWNKLLSEEYGNILKKKKRYNLPFDSLDKKSLDNIIRVQKPNVRAIRESDFNQLQEALDIHHHLYFYKDVEDFTSNGFGYLVEIDGVIRSGASAYFRSSKYAGCMVDTKEQYRRQGHATGVSAAFINSCIENDIEPHWECDSEASVQLGKKLGYKTVEEYDTYEIIPEGSGCCQA